MTKLKLAAIQWEDQHLLRKIRGTSAGIIVDENKKEIILAADKFNNGSNVETAYPKDTIKRIVRRTIEL